MVQFTIQQIADIYPTEAQRERLLRIYSLTSFLTGSIISDDYRVQDGLHTPISLTKYGERISEKLRKSGVPFPESRLLCLLEMLGPEPLVDVDHTDIIALQSAINRQVKSRELLYPFRFGRTLYDKFNSVHKDLKYSLSNADTLELLQGIPQGVFQVDEYVCGPYGLLTSSVHRAITPTTNTPLQHCTDPSCQAVHRIFLETSQDAPVNENRGKIARLLERDGASMDSWFTFFDSFATRYIDSSEFRGESAIVLIGDALDDSELRSLLAWLLDHTGGTLRSTAQSVGLNGSSDSIVRNLDRAQILQLICTTGNTEIVTALDYLVRNGKINVPEGEVRSAVINEGSRYGRYRFYAELSRLGIRLQSTGQPIAPLRMQHLVEKMYNLGTEQDRDELLWQLRARPDDAVDRRLQRHLQSQDPKEVIEKLVLARRSNVIVASEYLNFSNENLNTDRDLVDTIMWKLGFPVDDFPDTHAELLGLHEEILLIARQNDSDPHDGFHDDLRGKGINYFVKLEQVLRDSIEYTTWALTIDHVTSANQYTYSSEADGVTSLLSLNKASDDDPPAMKVAYSGNPTMYALCRGFERLAVLLVSYQEHEDQYRRPADGYPKWVVSGSLQKFPFAHVIPFLDLALDSQEHILERLRSISRMLIAADTDKLRNGFAHPRHNHTDLEQLRSGLDVIRDTIEQLEADGFCRVMYTLDQFEGDSMLRQKILLSSKKGYKYALHVPSAYSWLQFPSYDEPQYIMLGARLKDSAEVLRFKRRVESSFSAMYSNYPSRPISSRRVRHGDSKVEPSLQ